MKKYIVFFASGNTLTVDEKRYRRIFTEMPKDPDVGFILTEYINLRNVDYIIPEDALEQPGGVVTTPTPDSIKEAKKKEHDRIIADPKAIVNRIKEREKEHEPE